jgi:hypothetical protein
MTMPDERYRAVNWARDMLEDLTVPSVTPKIPTHIRDRARSILRHYPHSWELDDAAEAAPDVFSKNVWVPKLPEPKSGWWWWK